MAHVFAELLRQPLAGPFSTLWRTLAARWSRRPAPPSGRDLLGGARMSQDWLLRHEIESSKHRDDR